MTTTELPVAPPEPDRRAGLVAGASLLLMAALAGVGYGAAVGGLVTPGDPARTAADVLAAEGLFRAGIVCLAGVVALDVVVAWALHRLFAPVDAGLSLLAATFRLVYAAVFLVAIGHLAAAADLLATDPVLGAAQIDRFEAVWSTGLLLFGVHLVLVGVLAARSAWSPRLLGTLLVVAGLGYAFDSAGAVLSGGSWPTVAQFTFVGEVLLALWLLLRAGRPARAAAGPDPARSLP
ncbi:DUF4386 domain-containing protein [Blastococcus xanthinilyticus]|uniref:Uncharacterized protein DUF4386 n=1 Tax=Blastococcus xanthinilyticus TaxID=1564164 RepID=A0A5S5CY27_9ACTN|nr:DUF4386 domain-containing protein [Blastococcus xanthinilyticus]TYP87994.1 uncharacterized protein DUF4386 [Blastococcus xanthinilyticus]